MRKRSKAEVEIRNVLSEILLRSLRGRSEVDIFHFIIQYCSKASDQSINRIFFKDLLENKANLDWVESDWKHLSKDLQLKRLFVFRHGNSIALRGSYAKYHTFICQKTKAYLEFISRLKTGTRGIGGQIEDIVKVSAMLFNSGFFFECHEFLEEIWLKEKGREKSFLKGLIHACVAFYHLEYENIKGTANYLKRSYSGLKEFQPSFRGIDVRGFVSDIDNFLRALEDSKSKYSIDDIPKIKLTD